MTGKTVALRDAGQHYAAATLDERQRYAMSLAKAVYLLPASVKAGSAEETAARVLLIAETGAMLGVHPLAALNGVHVIEGKPTISPGLMSGVVRAAGHRLRVKVEGSGDSLVATATLIRADDPEFPFEARWTMQRATAAGLTGKQNWRKYPEAMLKARAIAEVCREAAEDVLMGVKYTPEELDAEVTAEGEVVEAKFEPSSSAPSAPHAPQEAAGATNAAPASSDMGQAANASEADEESKKAYVLDELLPAIAAARALDVLTALFVDARDREVIGLTVDAEGTTVESMLWQQRAKIESGYYADETPASDAESGEVVEGEVVDEGPAAVLEGTEATGAEQ